MPNRIKAIAPNQTELNKPDGTTIFYSYNTPVVALVDGVWYKTSKKFSSTTSKHINQYLGAVKAQEIDQSFFDNL